MTEKQERKNKLARDILILARNTLLVKLRFLDAALSQFELCPMEGSTLMTDGSRILYHPMHVLRSYQAGREIPVRDYLHLVLHCVFRHMYVDPKLDRTYWNLACDIAVENVITELQIKAVKADREQQQAQYIAAIKQEVNQVTAEKIYFHLRRSGIEPEELSGIRELFCADDHRSWYMTSEEVEQQIAPFSAAESEQQESSMQGESQQRESQQGESQQGESQQRESQQGESQQRESQQRESQQRESQQGENRQDNARQEAARAEMASRWSEISRRMQVNIESFSDKWGAQSGAMKQNLAAVNREKYDYTSFLRKFAVLGEAMKVNEDEFDYIFYTYGLQMYENMPLIEPLEYKDVKAIREFVIAIDTSGSTSGALVQKFVQKTYNILKSTESFFRKINLHIIQCDAEIQEDRKITCQDDFDEYLKNMVILGQGGTDFRPVFEYVDRLRKAGELTRMKGLIYFTDGYGDFPARKPDYDTAFVFIEETDPPPNVPAWAIKLVLDEEEIGE